eukprot:g40636.t1
MSSSMKGDGTCSSGPLPVLGPPQNRRIQIETNIYCTWRTINSVKDTLWSARTLLVFRNNELTPNEGCRLAHSKVQDYVLWDMLKL